MSRLQVIFLSLFVVGFVFVLGWAGDMDYCDQIIQKMSQEDYDHVKATLTITKGHEPSDREIVHYWQDHYNNRD